MWSRVSIGIAVSLILLVAIIFRPTDYQSSSRQEAKTSSSSSLVQVDFYGESLCPDCRHMVLDVLDPMFKDGTADLMNVHYIAWGKVRRDGNQLNCQHGPDECLYNRYINCAQKYSTDQNQWFPYVKCLAQDLGSIKNTYSQCATDNGLNAAQLDTCAKNGDVGAELEAAAAKATEALSPNLTFVPWIVVNGVSIGSSFEELQRYVCAATWTSGQLLAVSSLMISSIWANVYV